MTKFLTLPSLAIAVFFTNYHNKDHQIKMVKGIVEKDIRSDYNVGIVNNYNTQLINNAHYYDMNSQYPFAMILDMPVGNPVFTNNNNLDEIFGFVYGKITPTTKEILPNLTIENTINGEIVFVRESFYRWINSEQIKVGIKQGYKFEMMWGYKFERGKDVFKLFVEELFDIKRYS
jgi:DNA polymerase type B, organellar and viral